MYRNNFPFMELSSRKTMKKPVEPVDEWLQNEGYYRKLGPRDSTCLFRAISEQVYHNQRNHLRVREECINYMRDNKQFFEEKTMIPVGSYCDQMACVTEWGGENEVLAMSLLYKRNVVIFDGQKLTKSTTIDHGYRDNFFLCFTRPKQYETVYSQEYTSTAAYCQSVIYQILYKNVLKMSNVDVTVHKMLHERNHLRHDKFFLKGNLEIRDQLTNELLDKLDEYEENEEMQLLDKGITPFPYRVAKALDPNIYRNIEYDIWHEIRKEVRNSGFVKFNSSELQNGARCLVPIDFHDCDKINNNFSNAKYNWDNSKALAITNGLEPLFYTGHIQDMSKNQGPVLVFVQELGEKVTVPYEILKPYPQKKLKPNNNWAISPNKRNVINQNPKPWKKPWNGPNRRMKDQMPNDSNNNVSDKNQRNNPKNVAQNLMNKLESSENPPAKVQNENYQTYKEYNINSSIDNLKTVLDNTHISVETAEETVSEKKAKNNSNNDSNESSLKKQVTTNFNPETNLVNKQNRVEKNDLFFSPYTATPYPIPRFPGDSEMANYDVTKTFDLKGSEVSCSDPATVRHFYNLGVKYYWSQNMWSNGLNGQSFNDNTYFIVHSPVAPEPNAHANMMNGIAPISENVCQQGNNNQNMRHNNRSSPSRHQDQNINGPRPNSQKMNHRNPDFRNLSYQSPNADNRNRNDGKNANPNEQSQQGGNKEMQRGNKLNGMAPRFKRNYEGKNRNDHHNTQYQYRQQYQPEYDMRNKKQIEGQMIQNRGDVSDPSQHHQPQQQLNPMLQQQQQPQHLVQQPPAMIQPQTPPPISSPYPYPVPFNQVSYVPIGPYPPESEAFPGPYYQAPPGYMQVPYLAASDLPEQPIYQTVDSFSAQYPPVYSQYMYPPPPAIYTNQPPPADGCYQSFPGQPYFFPYPPPPLPPPGMQPANLAAPPTPQSAQ